MDAAPVTAAGHQCAYRVAGRNEAMSRFSIRAARQLAPFTGREVELEMLEDRSLRVCEGKGQVVLLVGEPGNGKSSLVAEFSSRLSLAPESRVLL